MAFGRVRMPSERFASADWTMKQERRSGVFWGRWRPVGACLEALVELFQPCLDEQANEKLQAWSHWVSGLCGGSAVSEA